jgi:Leucine-rich repeat (LRR) protein
MMKATAIHYLLAALSLLGLHGSSVHAQANDPAAQQEFGPAVVEAWTKAGAKFGWYVLSPMPSQLGMYSSKRPKNSPCLPVIRLMDAKILKAGVLGKLPAPQIPFALQFNPVRLSDQHVAELSRFTQLQALDLFNNFISDEGLKELAPLANLQILDLAATKVTDAGLKELSRLKKLRMLGLFKTKVTDAGMKDVARLVELQGLHLGATKVTAAGMAEIGSLKKLKLLYLGGLRIQDEGMKHVAGLTNLEDLNLSVNGLTDASAPSFAGLTKLKTLSVMGNGLTDKFFDEIGKLTTLESLNLSMTAVGNEGMKQVGKLTNLRHLDLSSTNKVTGAGLKHLAPLKELRTLSLADARGLVKDAIFLSELPAFPNLEVLDLERSLIGDSDLAHLVRLKNLHTLNLTHNTVQNVKPLARLEKLAVLNLSHSNVGDAEIPVLASFPALRKLNVTTCFRITKAAVNDIVAMKNIQRLRISSLGDLDVGKIRALRPDLFKAWSE